MSIRGYVPYNPQAQNAIWLSNVQSIVQQYSANWPLTARQIFYRMVASFNYPKTEKDYKALANLLARARRASLVDWDAIRDDGMRVVEASFFDDEQDFMDNTVTWAKSYRLDRQTNQNTLVEAWCEAAGVVPILAGVARPYSVRVNSNGGFDSVTAKHKLASRVVERVINENRSTVILHVGDFDPSGESVCDVLREDVLWMVGQQLLENGHDDDTNLSHYRQYFEVERVALTPAQVISYNVITAPAKPTDSRMAGFLRNHQALVTQLGTYDISAQLEALTPPQLEALLRSAIEARFDMGVYQATLDAEKIERDRLIARMQAA